MTDSSMKVFTVPGLYNSGPQHWQTHWENEYGFIRIEQKEWETPVCSDWLQKYYHIYNYAYICHFRNIREQKFC